MKEQLETYFTEHERSNIGLVIKTRFGYVDKNYLDDLWDLGYYATWIARNTYDEERGRKYSTYQYQLVFNEIYKFVNSMYAQKRNMKQSIHIDDMLTALPDTANLPPTLISNMSISSFSGILLVDQPYDTNT